MPSRCEFVDPLSNYPCGKNTTLAKIVINLPNIKDTIVKFVCKIHGDARFNYLSMSEIKLMKQKEQNKISYTEFAEKVKLVRWKKCRRCLGDFEKTDSVCCLEYMYLQDTRVGLRRSFLLHEDCLESELAFFTVKKDDIVKNTKMDEHL